MTIDCEKISISYGTFKVEKQNNEKIAHRQLILTKDDHDFKFTLYMLLLIGLIKKR